MLDQCAPARRHFTCKFPHKVALVTFPSAFRLRRPAQSLCRGFGPPAQSGSCDISTFPECISIAQARTKSVSRSWPAAFFCIFLHKIALDISNCISIAKVARSLRLGLGPRHFTCKFSDKVALVKFSSASRLHRLVQSLCRALGLRLLVFFCANKWLL